VEACHRQSFLAVKYCPRVHNSTWIVKVLKNDYALRYCFSVLREL
jgi:hypothetical protein